MPSLAALGARRQRAMDELTAAMADLAGRLGMEAPALPTSKNVDVAHAARLETVAQFLRDASQELARRAQPAPKKKETTHHEEH